MNNHMKRISCFLLILMLLFAGCGKIVITDPKTDSDNKVTPTVIAASVLTEAVATEISTPAAQIATIAPETVHLIATSAYVISEMTEQPTELVFSDTNEDPEKLISEEEDSDEEPEEPEEDSAIEVNPPYTVLELIHDGLAEKKNDKAVVDYSHIEDGYFMFRRLADTTHRYKVLVKCAGKTYQYNIDHGDWCAFPCSEGDGNYSVTVMDNVSGTKYANVLSASFKVKLLDPFSPFLRPNLNVNYVDAPNTMAKGAELTQGCEGPLSKVDKIYEFVVGNIVYDHILAATVKTGYTPDLDRVLSRKRGICYDYASLMAAMLRSQNVPTKLIFGYVGKIYHAWISVWVDEVGWVEAIYFDGKTWQRMDPTFAANGTSEEAVKKYVGNGKNYAVKFSF